MKKIVALVLSLVMALSLCTVAFAAETGDVFYDSQTKNEGHTYTYFAAKDNGDGYESWLAYFVRDDDKLYEVGDATGTALYENGVTKAALTLGDEVNAGDLSYYAKGEVVKASAWSCTTDKYAAGYKTGWSDGKTYYAKDAKTGDESTNILVNGEIKAIVWQNDVIPGQHVLYHPEAGKKEVGVGVYEAYCVACKQTVKVSNKMINGAGYLYDDSITIDTLRAADVSVAVPNGYMALEGNWYVVDAAATETVKDGVDSAKTFDAGVAMYVGMSLLSVAGGAVVIGKKKEF